MLPCGTSCRDRSRAARASPATTNTTTNAWIVCIRLTGRPLSRCAASAPTSIAENPSADTRTPTGWLRPTIATMIAVKPNPAAEPAATRVCTPASWTKPAMPARAPLRASSNNGSRPGRTSYDVVAVAVAAVGADQESESRRRHQPRRDRDDERARARRRCGRRSTRTREARRCRRRGSGADTSRDP